MCRISSLDEAKTVIREVQINSAGSKFELDGNGRLRSNRLDFIQYCFEELKRKRDRLWRTNFMAYNVRYLMKLRWQIQLQHG